MLMDRTCLAGVLGQLYQGNMPRVLRQHRNGSPLQLWDYSTGHGLGPLQSQSIFSKVNCAPINSYLNFPQGSQLINWARSIYSKTCSDLLHKAVSYRY